MFVVCIRDVSTFENIKRILSYSVLVVFIYSERKQNLTNLGPDIKCLIISLFLIPCYMELYGLYYCNTCMHQIITCSSL